MSALVLAAGFSSVFLVPLTTTKRPITQGQILGESVSAPLIIQVTIDDGLRQQTVSVSPRSGLVVEALALAAANTKRQFSYTSRGDDMFVQAFSLRGDPTVTTWTVDRNGFELTDLAGQSLSQGDTLTIRSVQTPS